MPDKPISMRDFSPDRIDRLFGVDAQRAELRVGGARESQDLVTPSPQRLRHGSAHEPACSGDQGVHGSCSCAQVASFSRKILAL